MAIFISERIVARATVLGMAPKYGASAACYVHANNKLTSWIVHEHDTCTIHAFKHGMRARHDHAHA